MGFRQHRSTWPGAPEQSRQRLGAIGVPDEALRSENKFIRYLTDGFLSETESAISDLSDRQFWELFDIITNWYDMQASEFTAIEKRRLTAPEKQ